MAPVRGAMDLTMCCTQAKSPDLSVGRPAKARPQGSLSQTSRPHFQRERRIGDDDVEGGQAAGGRVGEHRVAQGVAALDLEVLDAVQQQVHARDRRGGEVLLLPEQPAEEGARVAAASRHMLDAGEQHAAGAAGGVVDGLALLRVEQVDHQPHHAARGVELAGLLVGGVGELLDQVASLR
jgi:hypothetical protein